MTAFENKYSPLDQLLHRVSFKTSAAQIEIADLEDKLFRKRLSPIEISRPVFITALPRAGTTILLDMCAQTNEFVSHTYRHMPFLLTPLFWNKMTSMFRQSDTPRERAHGDGMLVSVDSPEAFEEMIWKSFWPSRYQEERIIPHFGPQYPEFEDFFRNHVRKIIALEERADNNTILRYISKNNLNISRLDYIAHFLPDSIILVPFRAPIEHASSLLRQHLNFLKIHNKDDFAAVYMKSIGHYDFGVNLRPVDFDKWLDKRSEFEPTSLNFWLAYWIHTYQHLLDNKNDNTTFVSFELFCQKPQTKLEDMAKLLKVNNPNLLISKANEIVTPKPYTVDISTIAESLLKTAQALYEELYTVSL